MQTQINRVSDIFIKEIYGIKASNYIYCIIIILITLLLKKPLAALLTRFSSRFAAKFSYIQHKNEIRTLLLKPMERFLQTILFFVSFYLIKEALDNIVLYHTGKGSNKIEVTLSDLGENVFLFLFIFYLTIVITHFIDFIYYIRMSKAQEEKNLSRMQILPLFKELLKMASWVMAVFWILGSVFKVNVPALIAGLGVGGVVLALAGKETLENFIASFMLLSDKPFKTGDYIKIADLEGTVERIGFRSTRVRNLDGSELVIPNQKLISQNLINFSERDAQGIKVVTNIRYGISPEEIEKMTLELKNTIQTIFPVKEPISVWIDTFDKFTFQLIIYYYFPNPLPEAQNFYELKHTINSKIYEIINKYATLGEPFIIQK